MRKATCLLLLLAGCGQPQAAPPTAPPPAASTAPAPQPAAPMPPAVAYTSGDRAENGPLDTLSVGQDLLLRLVPGSSSDFPAADQNRPDFSEARAIRQHGLGRVRRVGHTLEVQPLAGAGLRFTDDTQEVRKDENEERDIRIRFDGSIPGRPYWLLDSLLYEDYRTFLINQQSGRITRLANEPEISPNRQLLLVPACNLESEGPLNGLELLSITDKDVKSIWLKNIQNWQPQRVRWLDNHTIAIEQSRFEPLVKTTYARLLLPY